MDCIANTGLAPVIPPDKNRRRKSARVMKMKKSVIWSTLWIFVAVLIFSCVQALAQAGFDDDRVMLQGFYWESYRHGHPDKFPEFGQKRWYEIVRDQAWKIREGRFDLIWLPPPSFAGDLSAGYNPKEYFNLNNSYGNFYQHRAMLIMLLRYGIEPVADVVINHRDGTHGWADFKNPDWGTWAITKHDEAFTNPASEVYGTPEDQRGAAEERPTEYTQHGGTTYSYDVFRDIDHTNEIVRRDVMKYLLQLKSLGYRGWRYDMVHGFHARWVVQYNKASQPTFVVGEYDWDRHAEQRGWIWHTATTPGDLRTASNVFDFSTFFTLKDNKGNYPAWYGYGQGLGMMGDTTDGHPWRNRAVTFLENHDTGYRTHEDGSPQEHHESDSFANNWEVEQGYAYILTHPGVPCVYWKHYFDWGSDLQNKIKALINARKVAGVDAGSRLHPQDNARAKGIYAAMVQGRRGQLYVRIGGNDSDWQPYFSNYRDYREYAQGAGWKVWVALPGNLPVKQAPLKAALPIPVYEHPEAIVIPSAWLH
jgi:alpha-amylase